jgi:glutathione peroxidase
MRAIRVLAAVALCATIAVAEEAPMSFFDLTARTLDGTPQPLAAYRGQVVLVVNTASECGFTPQYGGLEKLYDEYKGKGFTVLGFPSNDFGGQEPGTAEQIASFCSTNYDISFPLFEKVRTKGPGQSPVYAFVTKQHGEPKWNFHKYLIGKDGQVLAAFPSKVTPESAELRGAIDQALAK